LLCGRQNNFCSRSSHCDAMQREMIKGSCHHPPTERRNFSLHSCWYYHGMTWCLHYHLRGGDIWVAFIIISTSTSISLCTRYPTRVQYMIFYLPLLLLVLLYCLALRSSKREESACHPTIRGPKFIP
jgi:hypothetical protein